MVDKLMIILYILYYVAKYGNFGKIKDYRLETKWEENDVKCFDAANGRADRQRGKKAFETATFIKDLDRC